MMPGKAERDAPPRTKWNTSISNSDDWFTSYALLGRFGCSIRWILYMRSPSGGFGSDRRHAGMQKTLWSKNAFRPLIYAWVSVPIGQVDNGAGVRSHFILMIVAVGAWCFGL